MVRYCDQGKNFYRGQELLAYQYPRNLRTDTAPYNWLMFLQKMHFQEMEAEKTIGVKKNGPRAKKGF